MRVCMYRASHATHHIRSSIAASVFALLCKGERIDVYVRKLQLAQLSLSGSFSWLMQRRSATNKMATGSRMLKLWHFHPPVFCMFFITTAGNTETRPACRYTRYSLPVLCLYNTVAVTRRRGLNGSLGGKRKCKRFIVCKNAARFKKGSRKVHDAWRTSEATLTSCLVILGKKNQRAFLLVFTKYIYVKFSYIFFIFLFCFLFFAGPKRVLLDSQHTITQMTRRRCNYTLISLSLPLLFRSRTNLLGIYILCYYFIKNSDVNIWL